MYRVLTAIVLSFVVSNVQAVDEEHIEKIINETCSHCHGKKGEASNSIYPRLAGQHSIYLEKQLRNFRDGIRKDEIMNEMAKDLTDEDINALAGYFGSQPVQSHRIRSSKKSLAAVGYYIFHEGNEFSEIPSCASCHGEHGEGNENLPRLAGQHKRYVASQLEAFHERERTNDNAIMHSIAKNLTELELQAVALYVSGLDTLPE